MRRPQLVTNKIRESKCSERIFSDLRVIPITAGIRAAHYDGLHENNNVIYRRGLYGADR